MSRTGMFVRGKVTKRTRQEMNTNGKKWELVTYFVPTDKGEIKFVQTNSIKEGVSRQYIENGTEGEWEVFAKPFKFRNGDPGVQLTLLETEQVKEEEF